MRKLCLEQFPPEIQRLVEGIQSRRLLVTRNGEPFVVVANVGNKDEEDLDLEESPEFWAMLENRRREKETVSLEEVMAELAAEEQRLKEQGGETPVQTPAVGS